MSSSEARKGPTLGVRAPIRERVARSVGWMVWSRGVVQAVSLLSTLLVVRLLSPVDYGLVGLASLWIYALTLISDLGVGAAVVQFRDMEPGELNACFWLNMAIATAGYCMLLAAAPWIAAWFSTPALAPVLRVGALVLPVSALRMVPDSLLQRDLALERTSQAQLAATLATIPTVLGLAMAGAGVWALVAGMIVMPVVQTAATFLLVRWRPGLRIGGRRLGEVFHYGFASFGARVCRAVSLDADAFLLGKLAGATALGFYSMAKQLATLPLEKLVVLVMQVLSPMLAEQQDSREQMRRSVLRAIRFVAWVTFPIFGGFMVVAEDLVRVILTDKWLPATPVIVLLCAFSMVRALEMLLAPALMAAYRPRFVFRYQLALMAALVPAFWLGALHGGAPGVALAWVTVYPVVMVWMAREALRELHASFRSLWLELRSPVAVTAVMMLAVLAVRHLLLSVAADLAWERLAVLVLTGVMVYGVGLLAIGGPVRGELLELAGWLFRRARPAGTAVSGT